MSFAIALFGEAERGEFEIAYFCKNLEQLSQYLGEPPHKECAGLNFAIQSLLYNFHVVFFRVKEEGYSESDYLSGLSFLQQKDKFPNIAAIGLPGVGSQAIIKATTSVCNMYKSPLILSERDLYDYFTDRDPS